MDEAMLDTEPIEAVDEATIEEPVQELMTEEITEETIPEEATAKDEPEADGTEDLLAEIERLKAELAQRDAMAERLAREGEEFHALDRKSVV